jgi:MFS family permease
MILAVLSLGALVYAILSSAVIPALPTIQSSLHTSETGVTWLLTGFLLSASVGTAIIGKLGDMYGKQRLLVWTLLALAAGTLLAALAGSLPVLIVARIIQGVAGGIFPLSFAIVRDEFPRDRVAGSSRGSPASATAPRWWPPGCTCCRARWVWARWARWRGGSSGASAPGGR